MKRILSVRLVKMMAYNKAWTEAVMEWRANVPLSICCMDK